GGASGSREDTEKQVMLVMQRQHPELGIETLKAMRSTITVISDIRTNSLVVMAPAESMRLMEALVAAVDVPPQDAKMRVFRLRNGDAEQMVETLQDLFERRSSATSGGRGGSDETGRVLNIAQGGLGEGGRQEIAFTTDIRTNSIIAAGTQGYLDLAEKTILELDVIPIEDRVNVVYNPQNIEAEKLAESIKSLNDAEQQRLQDIGSDVVSIGVKQASQFTAIANADSNRLLLNIDPRMEESILNVVRQLDQPPPQVMIQVLILEVLLDNSLELGVEFAFQDLQWAKAGVNDSTTFDYVVGTDLGAAGSGLGGFTFTITGKDFNFLFRTLQNEGTLNVLSRPQIVAMHNQEAEINVSNSVPYVTGSTITNLGQITTNVAREDVGIKLIVTPQINSDGFVRMEIEQEVSDISGSTVQLGQGVTAPIFFQRVTRTNVMVKDQETVVLGGLINERIENQEQKVPLLGDLPFIGLLFRHQTDTRRRAELLVVLTPHIVRTVEDYRALSASERDRLSVTPTEFLTTPLMQNLRTPSEDEPLPPAPTENGEPVPLVPRETPATQPSEPADEYGPLPPGQRPPESAEPVSDGYEVPISFNIPRRAG
ncbi:MAG: secretin N-terminal domain-containing protein, partial [Planctomycetota bacterium]